MGNFRTTEALLEDLGTPVTHKEALRQDVFKYFYHFTGSEKKTCKLPRSSISDHIDAFIDAEEGREWFKRSPDTDLWVHSTSRPQVARALTELTMKWLKSRRAVLNRKDDDNSPRKKSTQIEDTISGASDGAATVSGRTSTFTAVNAKVSSREGEQNEQILDHADEETDPEPINLDTDGTDDDESLMDINEVLSTPVKISAERLTQAPKTVTSGYQEGTNMGRHGLELPRSTATYIAESVKQVGRKSRTPLNPPVVGSKRTLEDTISVVDISADNKESSEDAARKRMCSSSEAVSRRSSISKSAPKPTAQDKHQRLLGLPSITTITDTTPSSTAGYERNVTPVALRLVTVSLSNRNFFQQKATYDFDTLGQIPGVVLDYIGQCGRSSLAKANAANLGPLERRQHQKKCKLFRDLHADIESRLLSLVHEKAGEESRADGAHPNTEVSSSREAKVQVSSFCLWD